MFKSKVIEIFKTFTTEEIKLFRNFLLSPFHNSNKKVIKLFEILKKYYPEFSSGYIQKEHLFKKLYPGKKYSDIVMRILISDLLKLAEEFLSYKGFTEDRITEKKFLIYELDKRKLEKLANRHIKEIDILLESEKLISNRYFLNRYELESVKFDLLISADKQDKSGNILEKQGEYLVNFFLMNGLNIFQEMHEFREVLNYKFAADLPGQFLKNINVDNYFAELKNVGYKYYPLLSIYYNLYTFSFNNSDNEKFYNLKNSIIDNLDYFDESERNNLLLALESCAITRIRMGIKRSREDLMEVYELMISEATFSVTKKKFIQANLFRNIFYTALLLKRIKWAENFADKYSEFLLPEQRPDMINYTGSMLYFERGKYEEALELVSRINYSFFVFKYDAKILMIKIHYELNSYEPALSLIDSFSHFLANNQNVSKTFKEPFMIFLKYIKELIKLKTKHVKVNKLNVIEVLKKAETMEHFMSKKWIIEKLKELG